MRFILILLLVLMIPSAGCKGQKNAVKQNNDNKKALKEAGNQHYDYSDSQTWLIGSFSPGRLSSPPHASWYLKGKDNYTPAREAVERLKGIRMQDITIKVVLGTWCPDSRREVPRFMRIVEDTGFPVSRIEFIGTDNLKVSPVENYGNLNIQRVPTFIFYRNNIEAGRIIENPSSSLEQDMVDILSRNEK